MLRKLYNKLTTLLSQDNADSPITPEEHETLLASRKEPTPAPQEKQAVELNLDTGKLILPDDMSEEEKKEIEAALAELKESLQNFTQDQFKSLEDYLTSATTGTAVVMPFITVNNLQDALSQVSEEMGNHHEDTEHWSNEDFIESLLSCHNEGYDFPGFEDMYNKIAQKQELSDSERKQLEQWYMLVSMELVYDV